MLGKCLGGPKVHVKALICELSVEVVEVVAGGPGSHRVGAAILTMWQLFFLLFFQVGRKREIGGMREIEITRENNTTSQQTTKNTSIAIGLSPFIGFRLNFSGERLGENETCSWRDSKSV